MAPVRNAVCGLGALLLFAATTALFAGTTGKIAGKVTDAQTKEALIGVNVVIVGTSMGGSTNVDGEYFILNIPPGTYGIKASSVGFTPVAVTKVQVTVDKTTRIDLTLQSQTVEIGDVVVTATRPIVQRDLTSTVGSMSSDQISKLPLEDVMAVVNLQAGVVEGHFRGGRTNEVKYLVDGVSVNDVFSGNFAMQADVNSIAEIQVLSGTFNAEYGEALSGVVNQVTKIAGDNYTGEISAYTGDYVSGRTGLYQNVSHVSPTDLYNFQGSVSGPIPVPGNLLKFFVSGRYYYDDGYIYGKRVFNPTDSSNFSATDSKGWYIGNTGDSSYVPMNFQKRLNLQGKISIKVGSGKGIVLSALYQSLDYRDYDHPYQLNPDGDYKKFQKSFLGSVSYTHVLNEASFLDFNAAIFASDFKQYVYEDPFAQAIDPLTGKSYYLYTYPNRVVGLGPNSFLTGGTQNWHFQHNTNTYTGRVDLTAQVSPVHQMKAGVEFQQHQLKYTDFQIHVDAASHYIPALPVPGDPDYNIYESHPYQIAAFVQDKIELSYLVVNIGLRFDYFQPDGSSLIDPDNIAALDSLSPDQYPPELFHKASAKWQFSPRIGISYPITDRGAIHLSYGHFFQTPPFDYLYRNPNFRIPLNVDYPEFVGNVIGNADLQPQRTTMYEIGLQQELTPTIGLTVTGYYKDIRNLLGVQLHIKNNLKKFGEYVNRDYGAVRGFTVSFEKRMSNGFGGTIDYTYQIAEGDASDPNDDFNRAQANPPIESNKELVPLGWDRRHSLNLTMTVGDPDGLIASVIGRLGSGLPYTPSLQNQRTGLENSANMPAYYTFDLYVTKYIKLPGVGLSLFLKVYNLFDTANEINVFGDTGRAGYTLELTRAQGVTHGVNTVPEYYTRPDYYSAPRQVLLGATVGF